MKLYVSAAVRHFIITARETRRLTLLVTDEQTMNTFRWVFSLALPLSSTITAFFSSVFGFYDIGNNTYSIKHIGEILVDKASRLWDHCLVRLLFY